MRVCIHHEAFDRDVSSGNDHAAHQWHELCSAFGVTHLAVINESGEPFLQINDSVEVTEITSLDDLDGPMVGFEVGNFPNHRGTQFNDDCWLVFGGAIGIPTGMRTYTIPTPVALYPREAAAIVLENQWQLRL